MRIQAPQNQGWYLCCSPWYMQGLWQCLLRSGNHSGNTCWVGTRTHWADNSSWSSVSPTAPGLPVIPLYFQETVFGYLRCKKELLDSSFRPSHDDNNNKVILMKPVCSLGLWWMCLLFSSKEVRVPLVPPIIILWMTEYMLRGRECPVCRYTGNSWRCRGWTQTFRLPVLCSFPFHQVATKMQPRCLSHLDWESCIYYRSSLAAEIRIDSVM